MQFQLFTNITNTLREFWANKTRTFLSLLSVSIGIFCITAVLCLVDSLEKTINTNLSALGSNVIYINRYPWMPEKRGGAYKFWEYKARPINTQLDLRLLKANLPSVSYASMLYTTQQKVAYNDKELTTSINAVNFDYIHLQNIEIAKGRYFSQAEMQGQSYATVIGAILATKLFGTINPVGKTIKLVNNNTFTIIGVIKEKGRDFTGFNTDETAICSYNTINTIIDIEGSLKDFGDNTIMVQSKKGYTEADFKYELKGALRNIRRIAPLQKDNFSLNSLSAIQNNIKDVMGVVNLAGVCIGLLSLLVGAFGIANIMYVTVKERTKQIGLKKALGAKRRTILIEFLMESILLCVLGGLLGMFYVQLLAWIITAAFDLPVTISIQNFAIGIGISTVIGIISGMLPANSASKLNPVIAIRS